MLSYDRSHWVDDFGTLADARINRNRRRGMWGRSEEIDADEFKRVWEAARSSPVWELFRTVYQMTKRPFVVGSLMEASGYVWALVRRMERPVSHEMVEFCRREQMQRLRTLLTGGPLRAHQ